MKNLTLFRIVQLGTLTLFTLITLTVLCILASMTSAFISFVTDSAAIEWLVNLSTLLLDLLFNSHLILVLLGISAALLILAIFQRWAPGAKTVIFLAALDLLLVLIPSMMFYILLISESQ